MKSLYVLDLCAATERVVPSGDEKHAPFQRNFLFSGLFQINWTEGKVIVKKAKSGRRWQVSSALLPLRPSSLRAFTDFCPLILTTRRYLISVNIFLLLPLPGSFLAPISTVAPQYLDQGGSRSLSCHSGASEGLVTSQALSRLIFDIHLAARLEAVVF